MSWRLIKEPLLLSNDPRVCCQALLRPARSPFWNIPRASRSAEGLGSSKRLLGRQPSRQYSQLVGDPKAGNPDTDNYDNAEREGWRDAAV